jgi:dTDP-4-amino-4,6-dideoxygalactose transaminase
VRDTFLPFSPPTLGDEEIQEVVDTLRSQWITTGPKTRRFEAAFAEHIGAPAALALNSCTAGLHVALATLGIGPGDEVITTPMTFCASANVIEHVGARPVLVDIDPETLQIAPEGIRAAVTPRTRAILPVHYTGHPCDMDAIGAIAKEHGLAVVEDAAHALPAAVGGRTIGTISDFTAFSFYATKNLSTAEGGMLTARDPELLDRARMVSLHGMSRDAYKRYDKGGSWFYEVVLPGFKYNMTDIQAAIGLKQLEKLERFQKRRRELVERYHAAFAGHPALQTPPEQAGVEHAWHLYVLRLNPAALTIGRDRFIEELTARNIGTSVHFIPVHMHPYYREKYGYRPEDFPVARDTFERAISLPLHPGLTDAESDDVTGAVLDVAARFAA